MEKNEDLEDGEEGTPEDEPKVSITQEKLNSEIANARRKGKEQGRKQFLKDLGLEEDASPESIKERLEAAQEAENANKTALELAEGKVSALQKAQDDIEKKAVETINRAVNLLVVAAIKESIVNLETHEVIPEAVGDIVTFIQADKKLSEMVKFDEETNEVVGTSKALAALLEAKPYLAKKRSKDGPGTDVIARKRKPESLTDESSRPSKPLVSF